MLLFRLSRSYLGGGHSPNLVVVRPHENVRNALADVAHDPVIEVLGLVGGHAGVESGIDHAVHAGDLVLLGKHGDVVLEGVGDPLALVADVGDTLVLVPVGLVGESLVDAVVEVLVVGEDDVAADIVELEGLLGEVYVLEDVSFTYEAFGGDICAGKTAGGLVAVDDHP